MKILIVIIAVAAFLYFSFIIMLYLKQNAYVYFPPKPDQIDLSPLAKYKHQSVMTKDGVEIKGYYLAPSPGKAVILKFHGNASHPAWETGKFRDLAGQGYGFFLAEYRGYAGNPGVPNEENLYLDGQAYLDWINASAELKGHPVIVYGASIGSGVAVDVAKNNPDISALILEVPFTRLSSVGAYHYPYIPFGEVLMKNKFSNIDKIKDIKAPILFLLARKDAVVPIGFGQALADAANEPKQIHIFEEANHVDVFDYGAEKIIGEFVEKYAHD